MKKITNFAVMDKLLKFRFLIDYATARGRATMLSLAGALMSFTASFTHNLLEAPAQPVTLTR